MATPIFLRRDKDGRALYRIRYQPGGKYKASFTGPHADCLTWHAGQVAADAAMKEVARATSHPATPGRQGGSGTVRDLVEKFRRELDGLASAHSRGGQLNSMLRSGAAFIDRQAVDVTPDDLRDWFKLRLKTPMRGGKLMKPSVVKTQLAEWRRIFHRGAINGWCGLTRQSVNPADLDASELPKLNPEGRPVKMVARDRALADGEWERWLAAAHKYFERQNQWEAVAINGFSVHEIREMGGTFSMPNYAQRKRGAPCGHGNFSDPRTWKEVHPYALIHIIEWKRLTGMRHTETLKLKIANAKSEKTIKLILTKTGDDQTRALAPEVWPWLKEYLRKRTEWIGRSLRKDEPLFPWYTSIKNISTHFRRICDMAGIEGLVAHDLRADFATRIVDRLGGNISAAQRFTGHKDPKTLMKIYYRLSPEKAADMLRHPEVIDVEKHESERAAVYARMGEEEVAD
jgi:integrase